MLSTVNWVAVNFHRYFCTPSFQNTNMLEMETIVSLITFKTRVCVIRDLGNFNKVSIPVRHIFFFKLPLNIYKAGNGTGFLFAADVSPDLRFILFALFKILDTASYSTRRQPNLALRVFAPLFALIPSIHDIRTARLV